MSKKKVQHPSGKVALGYHVSASLKLPRGDGRKIVKGKIYEARFNGRKVLPRQVKCCHTGMHASPTPYDALTAGGPGWADTTVISYVLIRGITPEGEYNPRRSFSGDGRKLAGYTREHLIVRELSIQQRLHLAYLMGGGGGATYDLNRIKEHVNHFLYELLGHPEARYS